MDVRKKGAAAVMATPAHPRQDAPLTGRLTGNLSILLQVQAADIGEL